MDKGKTSRSRGLFQKKKPERGIPESVLPSALNDYLLKIMAAFLPNAPPAELVIDRNHRLPKPTHLPDTIPRDTIVRIHFLHLKEGYYVPQKNPPRIFTCV